MVQRPPGAASGEPEQQALFGWPDIAATPDAQPAFRDSPEARRMLDVREVYAGKPHSTPHAADRSWPGCRELA